MEGILDPLSITKYWKNQTPPTFSLYHHEEKFTDEYFPPKYSSLVSRDKRGDFTDERNGYINMNLLLNKYPNLKNISWKRIEEIFPEITLFPQQMSKDNLPEETLNNNYFITSLSFLLNYPYIIKEKFRFNKFNQVGYYEIILFIDGEWQIIFVDDYFPYDENKKEFLFSKPKDNLMWVMLLEKVWAKVNGGYSNIMGGKCEEVIFTLSSFPIDIFEHNENTFPKEKLIEIFDNNLSNDKNLVLSSTKEYKYDDKNKSNNGILKGYYYSVVDIKRYENKKANEDLILIQMKNLYGNLEWKGEYSEENENWNEELKKTLEIEFPLEEGTFYLTVDEYYSIFDNTQIIHPLLDYSIKQFYFNEEKLFISPSLFHLYAFEKCKINFSILNKKWRFNREIMGENSKHPFHFIFVKYDVEKKIEKMFSKFVCDEDLNYTLEEIENGNYLVVIFPSYYDIVDDPKFRFIFKISANKKFKCEYIDNDSEDCKFFKMLIHNYSKLYIKQNNINLNQNSKEEYQFFNECLFENLSSLIITNTSKNKLLTFEMDIEKLENTRLVSPYSNILSSETIKINLLPNKTEILIGLCTSNNGNNFIYNQRVNFREIEIGENDENLDIIEKKKEEVFYQKHLIEYEEKEEIILDENNNQNNTTNIHNLNLTSTVTNQLDASTQRNLQINKTLIKKEIFQIQTKEYRIVSKDSINKNPKFFNSNVILISGEMVDREDLTVNIPRQEPGIIPEDIIEDYQEDIDYYLDYLFKNQKIKPIKKGRRSAKRRTRNNLLSPSTVWKRYENDYGTYVTPNDNYTDNIKGSGIFYPKDSKDKIFGNFINSYIEGEGLICHLINEENIIIYKGHFVNGKKSGKGILYISPNEYYEGEFFQNHFHGYGIYHYPDGSIFDGFFLNGKKNGIGIYSNYFTKTQYYVLFENDAYKNKFYMMGNREYLEDANKKIMGLVDNNENIDFDEVENKFLDYEINFGNFKTFINEPSENNNNQICDYTKHKILLQKINDLYIQNPFMATQFLSLKFQPFEEDDIQLIETSNQKYCGGVKNGKIKHGRGAFLNGKYYYIGYFENDNPKGYMFKFDLDELIVFQGYLNKEFKTEDSKNSKLFYKNGNTYYGQFKDGLPSGIGKYFFHNNNDLWIGNFMKGQFHGNGKYLRRNWLISENKSYFHNKITKIEKLMREDFTIKASTSFFEQVQKNPEYKGVREKLLEIYPIIKYFKHFDDTYIEWKIINLDNNKVYLGQVDKRDIPHGKGCLYDKNNKDNNIWFIGYFIHGEKNGKGTYYNKNWEINFQGNFFHDIKNGFGRIFNYFDQEIIDLFNSNNSNEKNENYDEFGVPIKPQFSNNKLLYVGELYNDLPNGKGIIYNENQSKIFQGIFMNGVKSNYSYYINKINKTITKIMYMNGEKISSNEDLIPKHHEVPLKKAYVNFFKEHDNLYKKYKPQIRVFYDKIRKDNLQVSLKFHLSISEDNNGFYIGEVNKLGFKEGFGILFYPNASTKFYIGYFKDNQKDGLGTIYLDCDKIYYSGEFKYNEPYGKGKYYLDNNEFVEGNFNEVGSGNGIYTFKDGSYWQGGFYGWNMDGQGELFGKNGDKKGYKKYYLHSCI